MIDTLRTLAQPYSHWLMSHRDTTIVVMGLVLMWTAGQALLMHWRNQRLHRDLTESRTDSRVVMRRNYTPAGTPAGRAAASEPESTSGLPPVRGGRTYARNLGNALQKAGMAPTPVYSPPTPVGWGPGPAPTPGRGAPPGPPAYAAPTLPWASPAQPVQPSSPRPMPAPSGGSPWPTYVPPAGPGQPASPSPQPAMPFYTPGPAGPDISQPPSGPPVQYGMPVPPPTLPQAAPAPLAGVPLSEPVPPPLPSYAPASPPVQAWNPPAPAQPAPPKAKRRRFSLQVLQNLEKTLQRTTGLGASSPVAEPPGQAAPAVPIEVPAAPLSAVAPAPPPEPEAPSGPTTEEQPVSISAAEETAVAVPEAEETPTVAPEPEPTAWKEAEPGVSDTRAAMRAMLFGEDEKRPTREAGEKPATVAEPEPESEEPVFRFEPVTAEASAPSHEPAPAEEAATPAETDEASAEPFEVPSEAAEPIEAHWGAESPHETADVSQPAAASAAAAADEPEPVTTRSSFDAVLAEPATAAAEVATPESTGPSGGGGDRGRLVIIEDDPGVAEYYATLFRGNGFEVHVASDGISGVDLCTRVRPGVVLLDVMMPRQNGMLVLQTLRASDETKETPVVVLSNFSEPTLIKRALQLGALEYVIKTQVEGAALLEAVPRWMNREKAFAAA